MTVPSRFFKKILFTGLIVFSRLSKAPNQLFQQFYKHKRTETISQTANDVIAIMVNALPLSSFPKIKFYNLCEPPHLNLIHYQTYTLKVNGDDTKGEISFSSVQKHAFFKVRHCETIFNKSLKEYFIYKKFSMFLKIYKNENKKKIIIIAIEIAEY